MTKSGGHSVKYSDMGTYKAEPKTPAFPHQHYVGLVLMCEHGADWG